MFKGVYTALVTPFKDGKVDEAAFTALVEEQVKYVDGILPVGTTGESPTLSVQEHLKVIELAVKVANKRIKVVAGTGANCTEEAIHLSKEAEALGADACLQTTPYYNKPSQDGLYAHFSAVAEKTSLPIILYSIPGRCGIEIAVNTVKKLAENHKNIVCIKEAGGNPDRVSQIRAAVKRPDFTILSGDDPLTLCFMAVGASGVISVASNLIPEAVCKMVQAFAKGDMQTALAIHEKYYSLFKNLFIETNPVPAKTALAMMGKMEETVRLPLFHLTDAHRQTLAETLRNVGLIK